MTSDGYLPFRDNVEHAAEYGVTANVELGGSMRAQEVTDAAMRFGIKHVQTGLRLFHHQALTTGTPPFANPYAITVSGVPFIATESTPESAAIHSLAQQQFTTLAVSYPYGGLRRSSQQVVLVGSRVASRVRWRG